MSDIFREVDEELQRKQFKKLWDRYGYVIIATALLIVALTAGYRGWQAYRDSVAAERGDRFLAALEMSEQGRAEEARAALEELADDAGRGYSLLARFRAASDRASAGDVEGAIEAFDALSRDADYDTFVQDLARIRAGYLAVDVVGFDAVSERVSDLVVAANPLRFSAREILGLSAYRAGKLDVAREQFEALRDDSETPPELRQRAEFMLALLKSRVGEAAGKAVETE